MSSAENFCKKIFSQVKVDPSKLQTELYIYMYDDCVSLFSQRVASIKSQCPIHSRLVQVEGFSYMYNEDATCKEGLIYTFTVSESLHSPLLGLIVDSMEFPLNVSFPLFGVGVLTLLLTLVFCCYMWRLKKQGQREIGYKKVMYDSKKMKKKKIQNDICAVCLEEFSQSEEIGLCPCKHAFHVKCIIQWLKFHNTCPMCKFQVRPLSSTERTVLVGNAVVSNI